MLWKLHIWATDDMQTLGGGEGGGNEMGWGGVRVHNMTHLTGLDDCTTRQRCTLIMKSFACLLPGNQNTDSYGTYRAHAWHCISDIWRKVYSRMRAGDVRGKQSRSYEINTRRTEGRMEVKGWPHPWATPTEEHNRWAELCSFAWQNLNKTNPGCFFSERCSSVGWSDFHRCIYSCQS